MSVDTSTLAKNHEAPPELGKVSVIDRASGDESKPATRDIQIGTETYQTNLPEGVNPFEDWTPRLAKATLKPSQLDNLPVGEYKVSRMEKDEWDDVPTEREVKREIHVLDGDKGKVIGAEAFESKPDLMPKTEGLMRALGFEIEETDGKSKITAIPTPETFKSAAKLLGIDVEFFPDDEYIPGSKYLDAYARGKYPISTKTEILYLHDIEDDHVTAMILGGEPLKEALQGVASKALNEGGKDLADTASSLDAFTATLRSVVAPGIFIGEAYGYEQGRSTLRDYGKRLGITEADVDTILEHAQKSAKVLGMEVSKLK